MDDKLDNNPEVMAGVAMTMAHERHLLRRKAAESKETARTQSPGSGLFTAIVVVAVLVGTLVLMLFMNSG